jgi:DNA-binding PadR family transcriptional regulator
MKKRSMQEPTFLILTALAAGPQHGYGIIADAGRISGGVTRLQTGTLYMALDRLSSAGLVEPDREEIADGRPYWRPRPSAAVPAPPSPPSG